MRLIHIVCLAAFSASSTAKNFVTRDTYINLAGRQATESACTSDCQVLTTVESCANSASCECTASIGQNLQSCINCLVDNDSVLAPSNQTLLVQELTVVVTDFNQACTPLGVPTLSLSTDAPTNTGLGAQPPPNTFSDPSNPTAVAAPTPGAPDSGLGGSPSVIISSPAQTGLGGNNGGGSTGNSGGSNGNTGSSSTTGGQGSPQGGNQKSNGVTKISSTLSAFGSGLAAGMALMFL